MIIKNNSNLQNVASNLVAQPSNTSKSEIFVNNRQEAAFTKFEIAEELMRRYGLEWYTKAENIINLQKKAEEDRVKFLKKVEIQEKFDNDFADNVSLLDQNKENIQQILFKNLTYYKNIFDEEAKNLVITLYKDYNNPPYLPPKSYYIKIEDFFELYEKILKLYDNNFTISKYPSRRDNRYIREILQKAEITNDPFLTAFLNKDKYEVLNEVRYEEYNKKLIKQKNK